MAAFDDNTEHVKQIVAAAADRALREAAQQLLEASNQNAPRQTGRLVRSGKVVPVDGGDYAVTYTAPYAVPVHERLDVHHGDGRAKFLEQAMAAGRDRAAETIADTIHQTVGD